MSCTELELDEDLQALHTTRLLSIDEHHGGDEETSALSNHLADGDTVDPGDHADGRERLTRLAKATAELVSVLDILVKKSQSGSAPSVFSEITDDDIDNLFND